MASPRPLALVRIAIGLCLLAKGIHTAVALSLLSRPEVLRVSSAPWLPQLDKEALPAFLSLWFGAGLAFLLGWRTRLAGAVITVLVAYVLALDDQLFWNHLYFLGWVTFLLTVGESGAWASLDSRRGGPRAPIAAWPVTLLCCQLSIVYAFTVLAKLNPTWLAGEVIERSMLVPVRHPAVLRGVAWVTLLIEAFLTVGLWRRRWRPVAFVVGLVFHASIPLLLVRGRANLMVFSLATLSLYLLFLDANPGSRRLLFDPASPEAARLAAWLRRLDWLGALEVIPASRAGSPAAELRIVTPDGEARGFPAVARALEILPLTFLVAPALSWALARRTLTARP